MPTQRARRGSPLNLPSAFELFSQSKELVLTNIWIFGPLYAVPVIFWIHDWIWSPTAGVHWWDRAFGAGGTWGSSPAASWETGFVGFSIFWLLITVVLGSIAQFMTVIAALWATEHRTLDFQDLWHEVKRVGWRLLGLYVVAGLYVVVGLILLIVPGLIMLRRYFLAPYVMIDKNCGIAEAMERSAAMTKPYSGSIWGIIVVMILIGFANIVPYVGGLLSLLAGLFYVCAPALRYQQLKKLA